MQKTNYQMLTDRILEELEDKPRILLHSCCGPCSSYVVEYLAPYFDITVLYFNPNIRPREEYERRLSTQRELLEKMREDGIFCSIETYDYDPDPFERIARGLEDLPEGGDRCTKCFELRLEETARVASEHGYPWFCTTLSVSPHKDAERLNRIGQQMAEKYGVRFLPSDFKKRSGYLRSIRLSEKYGLYRQNYCGCTPRE